MLSSDVWAEEVSNANNQLSFIWLISKQSWRRLQCSLASWRDWRLLSLRALLNFSPLARYIRTQVILWVHSLEFWELSVMQGDAKMFYTTGKSCLWVWGNLTATNHIVLRLILSLHESCHTRWNHSKTHLTNTAILNRSEPVLVPKQPFIVHCMLVYSSLLRWEKTMFGLPPSPSVAPPGLR